MFKVREDEPEYAKLRNEAARETNVHGNAIDLIASSTVGEGSSMYINADAGIGDTPNRNKQHGFHFTADNCIGCHACEAACSEKNDLPAHLSFRSVGYVEGGTYPNFTRMNISMACNHCDDPVCLKGCPTNAYTKHAEYGAVLQDPDTCFGCGYCTWVCPYNAPQLDPLEGHVQKCNMCVDRLEVGLKPACVSACVGNALDFGVIDNIPKGREQAKTSIPGFPDPSISNPNIRFQQTKSMPREFTRTDSEPVKYHRNDKSNSYVPMVNLDAGRASRKRFWNLGKLSSRENPLVLFTLITQAVVGAFSFAFIGSLAGLQAMQGITHSPIGAPFVAVLIALQAVVLFISTQHLGKPLRFYRGFNNLRYSPLSREALAISIFFALMVPVAGLLALRYGVAGLVSPGFVPLFSDSMLAGLINGFAITAVLAGLLGVYFMNRIYRIKARPFWDHWQVLSSFFGTCCSLGTLLIAFTGIPLAALTDQSLGGIWMEIVPLLFLGLLGEAMGHLLHAYDLEAAGKEGAASMQVLKTKFGKTYRLRNAALGVWIVCFGLATFSGPLLVGDSFLLHGVGLTLGMCVLVTALVSRALFYVVVMPTTMPGAFFWKNKGFEEHARKTGLARMPQVGVVEFDH